MDKHTRAWISGHTSITLASGQVLYCYPFTVAYERESDGWPVSATVYNAETLAEFARIRTEPF